MCRLFEATFRPDYEPPSFWDRVFNALCLIVLGYALGYAHYFMSDTKYHETTAGRPGIINCSSSTANGEILDEYVNVRIRDTVRAVVMYPEKNRELINKSLEGL